MDGASGGDIGAAELPVDWRTIFDSIAEGVLIADLDYRILGCNAAMCAFVGGVEPELLGRCCYRVVHGTDSPPPECPTQAMLRTGVGAEGVVPIQGRVCEVGVVPLGNGAAAPHGFVHVIRDVTRHVRAEEEVRALNAELESRVEERTAELEEANQRLMDASAARERFLSNVSHELRTPLNSIIGFSGVLLTGLAGELSEEQRRQVAMMNSAGSHLLALIEDVLDLSRVRAGRMEVRPEEFDARTVVSEAVDGVRISAGDRRLGLEVSGPDGPVHVLSDPMRVRQVLLNLLSNAVKFTEEGTVSVRLEAAEADWWSVAVADTGCGILAEDLSHIFEEFYQVHVTPTRRPQGTGLGLAVSQRVARLLGGDVTVTSEPGVGSTFTLRLPRRGATRTPP